MLHSPPSPPQGADCGENRVQSGFGEVNSRRGCPSGGGQRGELRASGN